MASLQVLYRPLRPSGNVLASHWRVLPSLGHRSAFSASSSVQFAPNLGEDSWARACFHVSEFQSFRFQVSAGFAPLSRDTACRVRNIYDVIFCIGGHGMPCPYKLSSVLCTLSSILSPPFTSSVPGIGCVYGRWSATFSS